MKFTVIIDDEKRIMESEENKTVKDVLDELEIPIETVVIRKNGELIIEEDEISDGDIIEVIRVIYGG
ncbi:MoaD/ThiS family protein [Methanothermobacter wolfeii]|uniref:MoaD/ThiS family protein n=1 Tax=Methanothermobacter wolfeii TaxID=145261 RepID=A0A9E7UN46_METWO|nr:MULTISPECIES: MoaD/ThiS family protein [Methanothermobacter]MDI6703022.1 MoaD/ThiS family protein [Methanothermobacter wolfeii]MDI6842690.1 MoaD/ThiS family protein [Methanothermobacter wolfeii]NLM02637.1 MoaD/ThiS family protein [Methanothermobacter wolfeii]QHN05847.1 MoaD/ThiS family protein [Methanothermobacter sp. THM-1]UXH32003.1 MoaD/ThiS family protein [Methanothermobacter wolfeii]